MQKKITCFTQQEITRICDAAKIDRLLKFNDLSISGGLALAIVLTRLPFPGSLGDMSRVFGISKDSISKTVNVMSKLLIDKFRRGIEFDERQLSKENLKRLSNAIFDRGAIIPNVVGFIDGTMQQTCHLRNVEIQNILYNEWNHVHCIKFQTISTPNGITSSLCGLYHGNYNGPDMFNSSQMLQSLSNHFDSISPDKAYIVYYGDQTYSLSEHVIPSFPSHTENELEKLTNEPMTKICVATEMEFEKTVQMFSGYKNKHDKNTLPALKYILATIFKNFHTCINELSNQQKVQVEDPNSRRIYIWFG